MEPERSAARRLHPATLLFEVGRRFASLALWSIAVLFFAARADEAWYLLFLLPPVVEAVIRYVSFRYAFTEDHLVIREGVLVRSVRHVPYARIQNIDTLQGPLHRLLDAVEVRLETAGGSEPEAVFRVISEAQLAELRTRVFGSRPVARSVDEAFRADAPFFAMRSADVVLFGLLSQKGLVLAGGAFVALRELGGDELEERLDVGVESLSRGAEGLGAFGWIALGFAVFVLLQLGSAAWAILTLHGFRIERRGEDLHTTCGLLTRQTASLPRGRVQVLGVRQGLLQRLFGRVSVRAMSAGGDSTRESQVARKWLAPLCPDAELPALLREAQPEASLDGLVWRPVHPRAVRRMFVRASFLPQLLALVAWRHSWWLGVTASALAVALAWVLARLRARRLAWALGERAAFVRDGTLGRRLACVRFEKIQSITVARSPLDRRAGMARVSIDTAGMSDAELRFVVPYLGLREACALARRLRREAAAVSFRW